MSVEYDSRDVNITAVDSVTAVVERGEDGTENQFDIPGDAKEIAKVGVVAIGNGALAAKGACLFRLSGGLPDGEEIFVAHGSGASVATGNEREILPSYRSYESGKGIRVKGGGKMDVEAEMVGEDVGEMMAAITIGWRT